jgi:hypothetical protein
VLPVPVCNIILELTFNLIVDEVIDDGDIVVVLVEPDVEILIIA